MEPVRFRKRRQIFIFIKQLLSGREEEKSGWVILPLDRRQVKQTNTGWRLNTGQQFISSKRSESVMRIWFCVYRNAWQSNAILNKFGPSVGLYLPRNSYVALSTTLAVLSNSHSICSNSLSDFSSPSIILMHRVLWQSIIVLNATVQWSWFTLSYLE